MGAAGKYPAIITLSGTGLAIAGRLAPELGAEIFVHQSVPGTGAGQKFAGITELTGRLFQRQRPLVFVAPAGVAVRAIAPYIRHKSTDPAVVVVDVRARWAVSLLSGHEGGANALALKTANILGCEPVITTSSEACRDIIAGVGCRKGAGHEDIVSAVRMGLQLVGKDLNRVRMLASADIKKNEPGLVKAADSLNLPLYFISSSRIKNALLQVEPSSLVMDRVGLPGVAEPCALLGGHNTELILRKTICNGVTVALARENFILWA